MTNTAHHFGTFTKLVMPAEAGIYPVFQPRNKVGIDPSLRWGDEGRKAL